MSDLAHLLVEAALETLGAAAARTQAIGASAFVTACRMPVDPLSACANGHGEALNRGAIGRPLAGSGARPHAVVVGEVTTDHPRIHRRALSRQRLGLVRNVGGVLAVVHPDFAEVALAVVVGFIVWVRPLATIANA